MPLFQCCQDTLVSSHTHTHIRTLPSSLSRYPKSPSVSFLACLSLTSLSFLSSLSTKTDEAGIQFRVLNRSKGPAVWVSFSHTHAHTHTHTHLLSLSARFPKSHQCLFWFALSLTRSLTRSFLSFLSTKTDEAGIQFRVLNRSKGPAVWVSFTHTHTRTHTHTHTLSLFSFTT